LLEFTASPSSQYWSISDEAPKIFARLRQNPFVAVELEVECGRRIRQAIERVSIDYLVYVR
jgi:hypothetical protein